MCDLCNAQAQYRFDGKGSLFFCLHHAKEFKDSLAKKGFIGVLIGNLELV